MTKGNNLVDLLVLTRDHLDEMRKIGGSADLNGDANDLAQYVTINFTNIFFSIFSKQISDSHHIMAALTRSAQEQISDFYYVMNHKSKGKVVKYLERLKFGDHRHVEYFEAMQGEYDFDRVCIPPIWTSSKQGQRIQSQLGKEEEVFYGLLCAYTHYAAGNHRFTVHKEEIVLVRRYFTIKLVKYTYLLAKLRVKFNLFKNRRMKVATEKFINKIDKIVDDWDNYLRGLYTLADLSHKH